MLDTVDIDCAVNILAKQAVEIAQKTGLDTARQVQSTPYLGPI